MKKLIGIILIVILCFSTIALVACNDKSGDEGEQNLPTDNGSDATDDQTPPPPPPLKEYERVNENGVDYIYFGSAYQKAVSADLNNALSNLLATNQLTPNEKGLYLYNGVEYKAVTIVEDTADRKLSNGLTTEQDKTYFFAKSDLKWKILEEKDGKALLLSDGVLGEYYFNAEGSYNSLGYLNGTANVANDYAVSALQKYLNEQLANEIFTEAELQIITTKNVINSPASTAYPETAVTSFSNDKLFPLSYAELTNPNYGLIVEDGFVMGVPLNDYQIAIGQTATYIANARGYYTSWWLRSNGKSLTNGSVVTYNGRYGTAMNNSLPLSDLSGLRVAIEITL